jgi:hypothetical protein
MCSLKEKIFYNCCAWFKVFACFSIGEKSPKKLFRVWGGGVKDLWRISAV